MVTGIADDAALLSTKRLSLLKSLSPNIRKVAMLWNKNDLGMSLRYEASAKAAKELGVTVLALGVQEPEDFDEAFSGMDRDPLDAILMVSDFTGPDLDECFERAAAMVDRIFKGAKPSELPFEQPTRYRFMINLKTAKSLGIEIPPTTVALADEVIE